MVEYRTETKDDLLGCKIGFTSLFTTDVALCIFNDGGDLIYERKITPRGKGLNYNFDKHELDEDSIINQMDESIVREEVNNMIRKKIIVGHCSHEKLFWSVIAGETSTMGRFNISDLAEEYSGCRFIQPKYQYKR